jgi:transcriptional regulator with XRE-family HTH domain
MDSNNAQMSRMKCERIRRGWTQQTLASRSGVSLSDLGKIENFRLVPGRAHAQKIAQVLKLEVDDLLQPATLEVVTDHA